MPKNIFIMKLSEQGIEFQIKLYVTIPAFSSVDLNCDLILCLKHPLIFESLNKLSIDVRQNMLGYSPMYK